MSLIWELKRIDQCTPEDVLGFCKLRTDVFFLEQAITEEEIDSHDFHPATEHIWCRAGQTTVGYVRVVRRESAPADDHSISTSVGRLVVHPEYRRQGIARELMDRAVAACGSEDVILHSQTYIRDFYQDCGFQPVGEVFDEAGIPHIRMVKRAGS